MQFDSLAFVFFFACIASCYWLVRSWSHRKNLLLLASYLFYAGWNPYFLPLLVVTSFIDWRLALRMSTASSIGARKKWLILICSVNLSVLAYFKYVNFFVDNFNVFAAMLAIPQWDFSSSVALPIGISFYTFHSLSYCIDVYRRKIVATQCWRDYLLYVAFFPQLVAGPIVRWSTIGEQLATPRSLEKSNLGLGMVLMTVGLFQKIVLADAIFAPVANFYFGQDLLQTGIEAWVATLAFSGQIFCDFAGYTTCAIGAALVLGFHLPVNFQAPYASRGFSDFWRRWHISLSSWLRDYLYVSLGGNRVRRIRVLLNLMITMLLGGLWHGAAWTYVVWGGLHGIFLVLERVSGRLIGGFSNRLPRFGGVVAWLSTTLAVVTAWVFFRAETVAQATHMVGLMYGDFPTSTAWLDLLSYEDQVAMLTITAIVSQQLLSRDRPLQHMIKMMPWPCMGLMVGVLLTLISLTPGQSNAFIYFQF